MTDGLGKQDHQCCVREREVAVNFDIITVNIRLKGFNCTRVSNSRFTVNTNDNLKNSGKDFPFTSQKVLPIFVLSLFACHDKLVSYTFSQSNQIKFFISMGRWSTFVKVAESEYSSISAGSTEKSSLYLLNTESKHLHQNKSQCRLAHVAAPRRCGNSTQINLICRMHHLNDFEKIKFKTLSNISVIVW